MVTHRLPRIVAILASIQSCHAVTAQQAVVPGDVLVAPVHWASRSVPRALTTLGLTVLERDRVSGVLRVRVPVGSEAEWSARLAARRDVAYAERNAIGSGGLVPNDTHFPTQWHLQNTGQSGGLTGADVRATDAWEITTGSPDVVIAVLDTGIDSDHPDFVGRVDSDGQDFVNTDADPEADHAHGSWVSGVIAANADNTFGVAGIDWHCRILPIKVLDQFNFGSTFDLAQGINYAATQADVQVINMSLINFPGALTLRNALQAARDAGKILIACAGNNGLGDADTSWPGASPCTISIGATTRQDLRAGISGTGAALDFVAPGQDIHTVLHGSAANGRAVVSGCSFATPIVAGVVGLLLARAESLDLLPLTQDEVHALLLAGAQDQIGSVAQDVPGRDDFYGHGRIDARTSLDAFSMFTCVVGNVGTSAGGDPVAVFSVDGSTGVGTSRRVLLDLNTPFTMSVSAPPGFPAAAPFLLFGHFAAPTGGPFTLPLGLGGFCFDLASPLSFAAVTGNAPWSVPVPGLASERIAVIQGLIFDEAAHVAVTNAVQLEFRM